MPRGDGASPVGVGVYVGYDDNRAMVRGRVKLHGATGALPAWLLAAQGVVDHLGPPAEAAPVDPPDTVRVAVDPVLGGLPASEGPVSILSQPASAETRVPPVGEGLRDPHPAACGAPHAHPGGAFSRSALAPVAPSGREGPWGWPMSWARRAAQLGVGLCLGAFVAEAAVRILNPAPRRMLVREDKVGAFHEHEGTPYWVPSDGGEAARSAGLERRDCRGADAFHVVVAGDSIFHGMDVPVAQVASTRLGPALEARRPGVRVCVHNLAASGLTPPQYVARVQAELPELEVDLVLLELWGGFPRTPVRLGRTVYQVEGDPAAAWEALNPLGLPEGLGRWLLQGSRLYEYAVLAWPQAEGAPPDDLGAHRVLFDAFADDLEARGAALVTLMPSELEIARFEDPPELLLDQNAPFEAWVAERGVENVRLWERFEGLDPAAVRLDGCHLNAAGHEALVDVFVDVSLPHLEAWVAEEG